MGGTHCVCDPGYAGADCSVPDTPNTDFLKEDFEGSPINRSSIQLRRHLVNYASVQHRTVSHILFHISRLCYNLPFFSI